MAEIKWNDEQKAAIDARNKSIAVSAAAGSGKTAGLVERIIRKICDSKNPVKVENLLVVTFTKAAANEMRERLYKALEKRIAETRMTAGFSVNARFYLWQTLKIWTSFSTLW